MTIHLGVKDRALLSQVGAESQKHCAQGSSKTLKQGGQWTGTNCVLTIKKTDDNAIPPRHKRTVEKCVYVCLSVCGNSSLSHFLAFKISVFQNTSQLLRQYEVLPVCMKKMNSEVTDQSRRKVQPVYCFPNN